MFPGNTSIIFNKFVIKLVSSKNTKPFNTILKFTKIPFTYDP